MKANSNKLELLNTVEAKNDDCSKNLILFL